MGYRNVSALKMDEQDDKDRKRENNVFLFHKKKKKNVRQKQMLNL